MSFIPKYRWYLTVNEGFFTFIVERRNVLHWHEVERKAHVNKVVGRQWCEKVIEELANPPPTYFYYDSDGRQDLS